MASARIYTYSEIMTAPVAPSSGRFSSDSIGLLKQRYLGRDMVTLSTVTPVTTNPLAAPRGAALVQIQIDPGIIVHFEMFPEGYSGSITAATSASPYMSGRELLNFGPGWSISFLQASF